MGMKDTQVAIIVGNGKTRTGLDIDLLKHYVTGSVFGCNALYRDYKPDVLVAVDMGMIQEILNSTYHGLFVIPIADEMHEPIEANSNRPRENAGMFAMKTAIRMGFLKILGIGFDFLLKDEQDSVSNQYDGTLNYGLATRASASDNPNRVKYLKWFTSHYNYVSFEFMYPMSIDLKIDLRQPVSQNVRYVHPDPYPGVI